MKCRCYLQREDDLIDSYTREEIKVEFILNCLSAKSKNQRTTEAHDIMATSVLEFISKIPGQSDLYTSPVFRSKQQLLMSLSGIQRWEAQGLSVNSMRHVVLKNVTRCYGGTTTKSLRVHKEDDPHFRVLNTNVERKVDWTPFHSTKGVWT